MNKQLLELEKHINSLLPPRVKIDLGHDSGAYRLYLVIDGQHSETMQSGSKSVIENYMRGILAMRSINHVNNNLKPLKELRQCK